MVDLNTICLQKSVFFRDSYHFADILNLNIRISILFCFLLQVCDELDTIDKWFGRSKDFVRNIHINDSWQIIIQPSEGLVT